MGSFDNRREFSRGRDRGRSSFGGGLRREMFTVDCSNCGKPSQVPFKPSGDRPVFCSDCFEKRGGPREDRGSSNSRGDFRGSRETRVDNHKEQFEALHAKLDKIMKLISEKDSSKIEVVKKKSPKKK